MKYAFKIALALTLVCSTSYATVSVNALASGNSDSLPSQTGNGGKYLTTDGSATSWATVSAGFTNPMTTGGDVIYGGASGVATRLANGSAGQYFKSNGTTVAPSWAGLGMASDVYLLGNSNNLIGWDSSDSTALFGSAAQKSKIRGSSLEVYTTNSITIDPNNGIINLLGNGSTIVPMLKFHDNDASQIVTLQPPGAVTANYSITLPTTQGTTGTILVNTDGSGQLAYQEAYDLDITITAGGTTGNRTINKVGGTVNFAAAATAITVTDSLVDTSTIIFAIARTNDSTCSVKNVVPAAGSFVINMTAACNAETSVGFHIIK